MLLNLRFSCCIISVVFSFDFFHCQDCYVFRVASVIPVSFIWSMSLQSFRAEALVDGLPCASTSEFRSFCTIPDFLRFSGCGAKQSYQLKIRRPAGGSIQRPCRAHVFLEHVWLILNNLRTFSSLLPSGYGFGSFWLIIINLDLFALQQQTYP